MIVGHGIDIVSIKRIQRLLQSPEDDWLLGVFTKRERDIADGPPNDVRFFAGRFAVKEAVSKALGTGISGEISWHDIEILRCEDGCPSVNLTDSAASAASNREITRWLLSISHTEENVVASVIAVRD